MHKLPDVCKDHITFAKAKLYKNKLCSLCFGKAEESTNEYGWVQ